MSQQSINLGTADRGNGDPLRVAFDKVNDNFAELYSSVIATGVASTSASPPASPGAGDLWWNTLDGNLYVYYSGIWASANAGAQGAQGAQGDIGPEGPAGIRGLKGNTGDIGPRGYTGETGAQGEVGPRGLKGDKGDTGEAGLPGEQGIQGIQGEQGPRGVKGDQGDPGTNGTNGTNGETGPQGEQGEQGLPGTNGSNGLPGLQGEQGIPGTQVQFSLTAPNPITEGNVWWDMNDGNLYVHYNSQWVSAVSIAGLNSTNELVNGAYTTSLGANGVLTLPDGSIINGATLKTVPGNYAGITAGPNGADEDSWVWVDNDGATIATKYSTDNHTWTFNNNGGLTFPQGTFLGYSDPGGFIIDGAVDKDIAIYTYSGDDAHGWTFGANSKLTLPGSILFPNALEYTEQGIITSVDTGLGISLYRNVELSAVAAVNSGEDQLYIDTSTNNEISVVDIFWQLNTGTFGVPVLTPVTLTMTPEPGVRRISVPGVTFVVGETYTFRRNEIDGVSWLFQSDGALLTSGFGTISHYPGLTSSLKLEVPGSNNIVLRTTGGDLTFGADGGLTLPGDLHGAEVFLSGEQPEPIVIGHTLNITPAPNASDKKFGFRIDQSDGVYLDSYLDMPTAENNKHVSISFALTDAIGPDSIGYIWNQGTDTNVTNLNNAFNIFANNTNIKLTTQDSDNNQSTWTFGTDGNLTLPSGNSVISNLVVAGDLSTGSQIQVGSGVEADTGIIISNSVTDSLGGGGPALESGSVVNVNGSSAYMALKTVNSLGGDSTLTGEEMVEVSSSGVRIGVRVTNDLGDGSPPLVAFQGWTFDNGELALPIGTVISETPSEHGLNRTKYSGNFVLDPTWFAANTGNIVNGDSFPEGILQNYDVVNDAFSFQYFGYFVPPTTANYTFRAHADETFVFWIGSKALSGYTYANKDMYGNYNGTFPEQQTQSFTIALTAGEFYPIRIQWANSGGIGQLDVFTWANDIGQADTADFTGRVFRENTGTAKIAVNDNRSIILSTDNATDNNWTFAADGSLTLPIGVSIDSSVGPLYPKIIADSGKLFSVQGQGNTGSAAMAWTVDPNSASQYASVAVTRAGGDNLAKVVLQAQSDSGDVATVKLWKFDETGTLTFPDGTTTTGKSITVPVNQSLTVNVSHDEPPPGHTNTFKINPESIKLPTGNGTIFSGTETAANRWYLDSTNNTLYFPDAGDGVFPQIRYSTSGNDGMQLFTAAKPIKITTASNTHWTFGTTGSVTLPAGGDVVDSTSVSQLAKRVEGSWTVTTGTNTYSFTVPMDGTYTMWVKGNIPNGIITWNATLSISNTNVPAIGTQYAWNYTGGGSPILLTTIPDQIRGTVGTISTDNTYAGTTSNRFDFGISNSSGSSQTIYYGWIKI